MLASIALAPGQPALRVAARAISLSDQAERDMRSRYSALLGGIAGAVVGATAMYIVNDGTPRIEAVHESPQLADVIERMEQTEALLREIRNDAVTTHYPEPDFAAAYGDAQHESNTQTDAASPSQDGHDMAGPADMALEEAMVQNIITRLYDPDYTYSVTLAELMQSEDMLELSDQSRERVVAEMVGMLNRGEIDATTFLSNDASQ